MIKGKILSRTLPARLPKYLLRLHLAYSNAGRDLERDIIGACKFTVREDVSVDNWNGGTFGHDVIFFLPPEELARIDIDGQSDFASNICKDLNKISGGVENEFFNSVIFEMNDGEDAEYQQATAYSSRPPINPDALPFWKPGFARLFISHRDLYKTVARELSDALEGYGIACFVAHDTILPMTEWRNEILRGLETMEAMLIYLTDDFEDSIWCHQEVGFALGKGVPIISLKLGHKDPPGFISHVQALRGNKDSPFASAKKLFPLVAKALGRQERLQDILIASFVSAPSWSDAKDRFDRMTELVTELTELQVEKIIRGFYVNDQLYNSGYLNPKYGRIKNFLQKTTKEDFVIEGRNIKKIKNNISYNIMRDDIPF